MAREMRLKIIKAPRFKGDADFLPPSAISHIYSFLKDKGFDISQEDLNAKNSPCDKRKIFGSTYKKRLVSIFSKGFSGYLETGRNSHYEHIAAQYLPDEALASTDILLISICYSDFCSSMAALLIARYFKSRDPYKTVIMGGESLEKSYVYEKFETYAALGIVDYYILGPGEESLWMLLRKLKGDKVSLKSLPGLCYRQDGKIFKNEPVRKARLVIPDFTGLNLADYTWDGSAFFGKISPKVFPWRNILVLPFRMIDGCPHRCAFCASPDLSQKKISCIEPQEAVRILRRLSDAYKTPYFMFLHDTFNFSNDFISSFCDEIFKADLKIFWSDSLSLKAAHSRDLLLKMYDAGARRLFFGLETASPAQQAYTGKNVDLAGAARVLKWSHETGVWTGIQIIVGFPNERGDDIKHTLDFIAANAASLDVVKLQKFYLRHYTYMERYPRKYGITNVREYGSLSHLVARHRGQNRYCFDEIGGLEWSQKEKQIEQAYRLLDSTITGLKLKSYRPKDELNVLFYLYSCLKEKPKIKAVFDLYQSRLKKTNKLLVDVPDLE
ncbi:MAG: radical SAM protein [Candidatus Omnitrophica bacterium]|nr:radical SAM protein [Candidatus Omnitrophota bacterium]